MSGEQPGDRNLVGEVEAVERLVEQQQRRAAGQRLRDQQSLLLASREAPDRPVRVRSRSTSSMSSSTRCAVAPAAPAQPRRERHPPPVTVEAEAHDVDATDPGRAVEAATLRQVADVRIAVRGASPATSNVARGERHETEHDLEQRRLAAAVRPEHRDELAGCDVEA